MGKNETNDTSTLVPNESKNAEEDLRRNHQRVLGVSEYQIGDTIFTVYDVVPENLTDEQFQQSINKKIERLVLNEAERSIRYGDFVKKTE